MVRVCLVLYETTKPPVRVAASFRVPTSGEWTFLVLHILTRIWCHQRSGFWPPQQVCSGVSCTNLHFPDVTGRGASVCVLVGRLCTCLGEVSVGFPLPKSSWPSGTAVWRLQTKGLFWEENLRNWEKRSWRTLPPSGTILTSHLGFWISVLQGYYSHSLTNLGWVFGPNFVTLLFIHSFTHSFIPNLAE